MIRTILIDAQTSSRNRIKEIILGHCEGLELLGSFNNDEPLSAKLTSLKPDLVLLDPEANGSTDLVKLMAAKPNGGYEVIFITSNQNDLHHDLKLLAFDYILKPVDTENTKKVLKRFVTLHQWNVGTSGNPNAVIKNEHEINSGTIDRYDKVILSTAQKLHIVDIQEIVRCEADKNYTHFYMNDGSKLTICKTLNHCENLLPKSFFLRTHKSHLVNLNYIRSVIKKNGGFLVLRDGVNIPVSYRRKEMVSRLIHEVYRQI